MTRLSLALRNLFFFLGANLLIVIGVAIGTAVLTGALLLGDSLKGSLSDLTLDRLGSIESALLGEHFFPASLAERLQKSAGDGRSLVPVVVLRGNVLRRPLNDNKLLARAGRVQVVGVDPRFWPLFGRKRDPLDDGVLINQALADALQFQPSDGLEVRIEKPQNVPSDSVLGQRGEDQALVIETSKVAAIIPNRGPGRFTLYPSQTTPLVLYVKLESLQRRLTDGQQLPAGSANVLLATAGNSGKSLQQLLDQTVTLEDMGFTLAASSDQKTQSLTTSRLLFDAQVAKSVETACKQNGYQALPTLTYLANRVYRLDGDTKSKAFVPYSTMVGVESINGITIGEDEVVVNEFVEQDLSPNLKHIWFEYFVESDGNRLIDKFTDLRVKGVVKMTGEAADKSWTPKFPGMKATLAEWKPPFPKSQWHPEWIRKRDEDYYKQYEATPKFFINPKTALKLFSSRYGDATSLRISKIGAAPGAQDAALPAILLKALRPETFGLTWKDVKAEGIKSATTGATTNMFGGLFAGFSLFLIVAALLLVALLFRLRMERRASEVGLLLATGWPVSAARGVFLREGMVLAVLGALLGIPLALGYAWLVIFGLRHGWGGLLASDALTLHYQPLTLTLGAIISIVMAIVAMWLSLRSMVKLPIPTLLAGRSQPGYLAMKPVATWAKWLPALLGLAVMGLMSWGWFLPPAQQSGIFFGVGFLCLVALLMVLRTYLRQQAMTGKLNVKRQGIGAFGVLNAARSPGRSLTTAALLAAGCFMVVGVGAFRQQKVNVTERFSGAGGFTMMAETDLPLRALPRNAGEWRQFLGDRFTQLQPMLMSIAVVKVFPMRLRSGDDVSCLNLYEPTRPRVISIPNDLIARGGFNIVGHVPPSQPWKLLQGEGLPVFLDDHTAQWIFKKQQGDELPISDEVGTVHQAKIDAILTGSVFQSEILMGEAQFRRLFPSVNGYRFFLLDVPPNTINEARVALETIFGENYGISVQSTAERIASYHAVENTYIGTFQALGALGLLLGTAGLALVILRNVQERRSELALLQAVGFTRSKITKTILSEVFWLVMMGLLIGCLSALVAVSPMLSLTTALQLLLWLGVVVLLVPVVALIASVVGIRLALNTPLIPALRGE